MNEFYRGILNFINVNTYDTFSVMVEKGEIITDDHIDDLQEQLHLQIERHFDLHKKRVRQHIVEYIVREFGTQAMGVAPTCDTSRYQVDENAWKKYRPRRTRKPKAA